MLQLTVTKSIIGSISFVAVLLAAMLYFDIDKHIVQMLGWLELQGAWALLWFVVIMTLVVVLLLPGVLFTTGAGFVFGVLQGTVGVVLGTTLGAALAFVIARYLFGTRSKDYILSHDRFNIISQGVSEKGFRIVLLTRLIPFFPSKISNYLFGLSQISFRDYLSASTLGFIPYSLHNAYLGSIAADIATLGAPNTQRTPWEWGIYAAGFVLTIGIVFYLNRLARRLLTQDLGEDVCPQ